MTETRELLTPYKFQAAIIDRAKRKNQFALFMDMGTGKSLTTINLLRLKYIQAGRILPTIIFCPIIVLRNWKNEFLQCSKIDENMIGVVEHRTPKKRLEVIKDPKHKVLIINYEALRTKEILAALINFKAVAIVCDESHRIKSRTTQAFKSIMRVAIQSKYRYILTGTPITNNLLDLFSQYLFLDYGATFGKSFFVFRNKYFINKNAVWQATGAKSSFPDWQLNESMISGINQKISNTSARIKKEDCIDLPDKVDIKYDIPLSKEQTKHHENIKKDLITWLENEEDNPLVVQNALVKVLRLNEISSGFMKLEDESIITFKENPRLDRLTELVNDLAPYKIIIYCIFKENYKHIRKMLEKEKIKYVELHGGVNTTQKLDNIEIFNDMKNDVRICLANTKSGGLGVNLIAARYTIYYTRNFNLDDFLQSRDRNYRAGSVKLHNKITHYHLIAPNTIDEIIYTRLLAKKGAAEKILDKEKLLTLLK